LMPVPMLTQKAGLSPHGAPSRDHDFESVTPDVRAPPQVVAVLVFGASVPRLEPRFSG
jgi:hypothetical protein